MVDRSHADGAEHALLEHAEFVRRLARKLAADEHQADDVAQDAWIIALQKRESVHGSLRAWLAGVVGNLAADRRRAHARRRRREAEVAKSELVDSFESEVLERAMRERLRHIVARLSAGQREVIELRYYEGLSPPEIAARLEIPLENVRTRLKRGLGQLRARLSRDDEDEIPLRGSILALLLEPWRRTRSSLRWGLGVVVAVFTVLLVFDTTPQLPASQTSVVASLAADGDRAPVEDRGLDHARRRDEVGSFAATDDEEREPDAASRILAGFTRDQSGAPVSAARVTWYRRAASGPLTEAGSVFSGADGSFELGGIDANFVLDADDTARRARLQLVGVRAARGRLDGLEFVLEPTESMRGRVLDSNGAPIEAATLTLGSRALDSTSQPTSFAGVWWGRDTTFATTSDRAGRFEFARIPPGLFRLSAVHADFAHEIKDVVAGETELDLILSSGVSVVWRAVNAADQPVAEARARVWSSAIEREFIAAADGSFRLPRWSESQSLDVLVEAPGFASQLHERVLPPAMPRRDFVLTPPRVLRGVVLARDGSPLVGANLIARCPLDEASNAQTRVTQLHNVLEKIRTGPDGTFEFKRLPRRALTVEVWAQRASEASESFEVAAEERDVAWRLGAADWMRPELVCDVRDSRTGTRIEAFTLSATPRGATIRHGTRVRRVQRAESEAPWRSLEAGTWWLHVEAPDFAPFACEIEVRADALNQLAVELHPRADLHLRVVDAAGAPVAFASVVLRTSRGDPVLTSIGGDKCSDEVVLARSGTARVDCAPATLIDLDVWSAWSHTPKRVRVDLSSAGQHEVEVTLDELHRIDMIRSFELHGLANFEGREVDIRVTDAVGAVRVTLNGRIEAGSFVPRARTAALVVLRRTIDLAAAHPSDTWREARGSAWLTPDGECVFPAGIRAIPLPAGRAEVLVKVAGFEPELRELAAEPSHVDVHLDAESMRRATKD